MYLSAPFLVRGVLQNQPAKCMALQEVLKTRSFGQINLLISGILSVVVFLPSGHTDKKVPGGFFMDVWKVILTALLSAVELFIVAL